MYARIFIDEDEVTDFAVLSETRINYDSTRRVTTASIALLYGTQKGTDGARYDAAFYDTPEAIYGLSIKELQRVTIRDYSTDEKLFAGDIFGIDLQQTDAADQPGEPSKAVKYICDLNDDSAWLDRSIAWGGITLAMPTTDQVIIQTVVGAFCPKVHAGVHVAQVLPVVTSYEWKGKSCRQVLDDMAALSGGEWRTDFDGELWYGPAADYPQAPFSISSSPDEITSFSADISSWKRDFQNPINHCFVRGGLLVGTGVPVFAEYQDPLSIMEYGDLSYNIDDTQLTNALDAELRAKTTVLKYAWPLEQGTFTIKKDGLRCGQNITVHDAVLGIDGQFIIRALTLQWKSKDIVEYVANFGEMQPNLEAYLRLLDQRTRWKTATPQASVPIDGSVSDDSIVDGGLTADVIESVNADSIVGTIDAGQIGSINADQIVGQIDADQIESVNASAIVGQIQAEQIESINAGTIEGVIQADQIGSVHATTIQGVIVSDQLADQIIDDLAKFTTPLRPVPIYDTTPVLPNANLPPGTYFFFTPNGHFYKINAAGTYWDDAGTNPDTLTGSLKFYQIGAISATNLIGLVLAAQIQSITAGQITGQIQAGQIGSVNASSITGQIVASQIASVNATAIVGTITADQITTINATQITGQLVATQIGSINAATITIGLIQDGQIGTVSGGKLIVGTVDSSKLNAVEVAVGYGGNKPGRLAVYSNATTPPQVALLGDLGDGNFGGWFKLFGAGGTSYADSKIRSNAAGDLGIFNAELAITRGTDTIRMGPSVVNPWTTRLSILMDNGAYQKSILSPRALSIFGQWSPGSNPSIELGLSEYDDAFLTINGNNLNTYVYLKGYQGSISCSHSIDVAGHTLMGFTGGVSGVTYGVEGFGTVIDSAGAFVGSRVGVSGDVVSQANIGANGAGSGYYCNGQMVINNARAFVGIGGINTDGQIIGRGQVQIFAQAICVMSAGGAYLGYIQADGSVYAQGVQSTKPFACGGQAGIGDPAVGAVGVDVTTPTGQKTLWFMGGICYAVTG